MNFQQYSETAPLRKVIIGRHEGYREVKAYTELVNESQKKGLPAAAQLAPEFEGFRKALEAKGVEVLIPDYVGKFVYDQLTPRDIGVTIGNRFLVCNMVRSSRRYEVAGIFRYLAQMGGPEPNIIIPPDKDVLLEGGDIIVDKGRIIVGISQRTNKKGFEFLQSTFGKEFEVIPAYCRSLSEGEDVLHLDCTFNPVGKNHALIYPDGFQHIPSVLRTDYQWIEVSKEEQEALATNVLSINEQSIIARNHIHCQRVNRSIEDTGIEVISIPFDGAPSTGGSFRCCSLPLCRV